MKNDKNVCPVFSFPFSFERVFVISDAGCTGGEEAYFFTSRCTFSPWSSIFQRKGPCETVSSTRPFSSATRQKASIDSSNKA